MARRRVTVVYDIETTGRTRCSYDCTYMVVNAEGTDHCVLYGTTEQWLRGEPVRHHRCRDSEVPS